MMKAISKYILLVQNHMADLHHGIVLLADLNRDDWPVHAFGVVVAKGHLHKAPQGPAPIPIFNCLSTSTAVKQCEFFLAYNTQSAYWVCTSTQQQM